jgi:membrane protein implicated in regulation of membrane protease activity
VSFLASLLAWANAPFTIVLAVAVVFAVLQMTGLLGLLAGGGDHDADADHDVDADADHDVDADHDADADNDHDADQDQDHDADDESDQQSVGHALAAGLGVGKVPLSIIWQTYAVAFGFAGIAINTVYASSVGALPLVSLAWTLPSAAVFGYGVTRVLARALGRVISDPKQEATTKKQLVGQTGVVISSKIDGEFGEIRLRDKTGHTVRIVCRTREPERVIPEGREVVIVDYEREGEHLYVAPLDEDDEPPEPPQHRAS